MQEPDSVNTSTLLIALSVVFFQLVWVMAGSISSLWSMINVFCLIILWAWLLAKKEDELCCVYGFIFIS